MTNEAPDRAEDAIIQDHNYDGIREYDNPMPGWWVWLFWASIVWSPFYVLGVHVFDFIPTYQEDLMVAQADINEIREAYEAANPTFEADEESLALFVSDRSQQDAGAVVFGDNCAACHGAAGEGLIGPNLTDAYWIHGFSNVNIFEVITDGVVEKGMTPWGAILSVEQRAQVLSYIRSLDGTNPPNAKGPEGTLRNDAVEEPSL